MHENILEVISKDSIFLTDYYSNIILCELIDKVSKILRTQERGWENFNRGE